MLLALHWELHRQKHSRSRFGYERRKQLQHITSRACSLRLAVLLPILSLLRLPISFSTVSAIMNILGIGLLLVYSNCDEYF